MAISAAALLHTTAPYDQHDRAYSQEGYAVRIECAHSYRGYRLGFGSNVSCFLRLCCVLPPPDPGLTLWILGLVARNASRGSAKRLGACYGCSCDAVSLLGHERYTHAGVAALRYGALKGARTLECHAGNLVLGFVGSPRLSMLAL